VPEGKQAPMRKKGDETLYNQRALDIFKAAGAAVNDLYAFALPKLSEIQTPSNVHFTTEGYEQLAGKVAEAITLSLAQPR
jgi:lysophospholipase L1-like esterase